MLNLKIISKKQGKYVFFRLNEGILLVFNPNESQKNEGEIPPHGANGEGHLAFEIEEDEFGLWRERLTKFGIDIESEFDWPNGSHSMYVRDPAKNSVEFTTAKTWDL